MPPPPAPLPSDHPLAAALRRGARVLFCEAPFLASERAQASSTGHLTARACAEIAAAAGVARLVPFHFSRRHTGKAEAIHAEIARYFTPPGSAKDDVLGRGRLPGRWVAPG